MKTALVTGSALNLGRHLAINLAKQNMNIAVHYRSNRNAAQKTLNQVQKISKGLLVQADLTDKNEVYSMIDKVLEKFKTIDILINLIGSFIYQPIDKTSFEKFRDVIESNLYSTFLCCQKVLPCMVKEKWGRIINFGCVAADAITVRKNTTPYYIAKTGVIMYTKVLAYQYAPYNITVNSLSPGILKTSIVKTKTPTNRLADFADISNAVNFLLKEESSYINGANLEISGGWRPGFE
ncbi:hypothetical protein A2W14_04755 [Candidatus Gottesmanbacteria bacterium RBG_16_37_8]|uniref:Short-chain dehydrogenase n=1 Tax=Candidatus Gottesmanbacteria bacterium RBG_16_37_8 TaxID=1798371 RepID=A0A1F5YUW7_9BACT|nr:MAG: hypothetical protein A2W14_04755 [Candidatus Gottesmanbacteria bacterium RBG_16_37_8]